MRKKAGMLRGVAGRELSEREKEERAEFVPLERVLKSKPQEAFLFFST